VITFFWAFLHVFVDVFGSYSNFVLAQNAKRTKAAQRKVKVGQKKIAKIRYVDCKKPTQVYLVTHR